MKTTYGKKLRTALSIRSKKTLPYTKWILGSTTLGILAYIALSLFITRSHELDYNFVNERGTITVFSAILLASAATFSLSTFSSKINKENWSQAAMWIIFAIGFGFLAFDELLEFHERAGEMIKGHVSSGSFRNWNDVIVILYGIAVLPLLFFSYPDC